jgi:hypothetical protein
MAQDAAATQPYVFLSHSTQNKDIVKQIAAHLDASGVPFWMDTKDIRVGSRWVKTLENAILSCSAMLVVMSRAARESEWVESETLLALDHKKPILVAMIEDVPLPLQLMSRQYISLLDDFDAGIEHVCDDLKAILAGDATDAERAAEPPSHLPNEDNFFAYLQQLPEGDTLALIARDLYSWAQHNADAVEFGGKHTPAYHVRARVGEKSVTVFSVLAYMRHPAVQVPFDYLRKYPPYTQPDTRYETLQALNQLMPQGDQFEQSRADRRPTLSLVPTFTEAGSLEFFKQIAQEIIDGLRQQAPQG